MPLSKVDSCILLHSKIKRNYTKELGISFAALTSEEKRSIVRPKQEKAEKSSLLVRLFLCDEKENKLLLRFNKSGIEGKLTLLDSEEKVTNSSFCRVRPLSIAHSYKCFERFKRFRTQFDG